MMARCNAVSGFYGSRLIGTVGSTCSFSYSLGRGSDGNAYGRDSTLLSAWGDAEAYGTLVLSS